MRLHRAQHGPYRANETCRSEIAPTLSGLGRWGTVACKDASFLPQGGGSSGSSEPAETRLEQSDPPPRPEPAADCLTAFAVVDEVMEGSPSHECGLKVCKDGMQTMAGASLVVEHCCAGGRSGAAIWQRLRHLSNEADPTGEPLVLQHQHATSHAS